jgi:uncharacterized protein DUF3854
MNRHLDFLLSAIYDGSTLHAEHLADLRKSGLTDETIRMQKIRTIPPHMIEQLLGFETPKVRSAYLIPYADPHADSHGGGWMEHVRLKIFPPITTENGTIKYLQPRRSGVRLYFPITTLPQILAGDEALWLVEGEKKALAVAQLGLPAVGFAGIEGWHLAGSSTLLADFAAIPLRGRVAELVPDGDVRTNADVMRGARRFAEALRAAGARPRLVRLPEVA